MTRLKILEWNINMRSGNNPIPEWVYDEIIIKNPDVIVLVEYKENEGSTLEENLEKNYFVRNYNGVKYESKEKVKLGNGILIALKREVFKEPGIPYGQTGITFKKGVGYQEGITYQGDSDREPNWLRVTSNLKKTGESIDITGVRVRIGKESKKDLEERKSQIEWILKNQGSNKQIIIGDLNYGPHRTSYKSDVKNPLNWQDIIDLMREYKYLDKDLYSPYSPAGTSWKGVQLDWLITRGITIKTESDYNQLDWSFGKNNTQRYKQGYLVPDGYFIRTDPSYPDHAIFTVEIDTNLIQNNEKEEEHE